MIFFLNMHQVSKERRFKDIVVTEADKTRLTKYIAITFIAALGVVATYIF